MTETEIRQIVENQRTYFYTGATLPLSHRIEALKKIQSYILTHEAEIGKAIRKDLGKSDFESYMCETGLVLSEITYMLKHIRSFAKEKNVLTPLAQFHSRSFKKPSPYGVALIMSPWNYPFLLTIDPLIDALAAGNTVVLKPSAYSPYTSAVIQSMIEECFDTRYVAVITGGRAENTCLLNEHFDYIFFTGSQTVGKEVMRHAAAHLTPVTLELGGKSPCIVDETANVKRAAQRVAWGKGINCGQTCVAPDYFLVHERVADDFVRQLDACFHQYYGEDILACDEWPHMISQRHFERVMGLIEHRNPDATVAFGGRGDAGTLRIEPTCLRGVTLDDPVMNEEIFGPVLPVITYKTLDEAFAIVRTFEKPLATYVFSDDKAVQQRVIRELPFGGATVNDVVIHLANNHMGFGGVGNSGMGAYHGKVGFDCFTHYKSTLKKGTWIEMPIRNPPFGDKIKLLRMLMR